LHKQTALAIALLALASAAGAQQTAPPAAPPSITYTRIEPPPQALGALPLYPGAAPGSEDSKAAEVWDRMNDGQPVVRNVTHPTITPLLPSPDKATGAAVIVAPGGGFQILSMKNEGWAVAKWLADHGVAAFVLKYRPNETPEDEKAFVAAVATMMASASSAMASPNASEREAWLPTDPRATADALQALKIVRANAVKWRIDPQRVGMMGFSAGAIATLDATLTVDAASRPSFVGYIYGPASEIIVPADAPPMFVAGAMDDPLFALTGIGIVEKWRARGRPVELHAYETGGHGFGAGKPGTTTTMMLPEFLAWMQANGLTAKQR